MNPRSILADATLDGLTLTLPAELDRADYLAVNAVLTNLGGRWSRSVGAHVFRTDPGPALAAYVAGGPPPPNPRQAHGYVPTPAELAEELCDWPYSDVAALSPGAVVLEPSAGDGALVEAILDANPDVHVVAVEPVADRADRLDEIAADSGRVTVVRSTLEEYTAAGATLFAAVVMNPPFALPGRATAWIDHVQLAWSLLAPGGRLASVVPASYSHRSDDRHRQIRALVDGHGLYERLPARAFEPSRCGVAAGVLTIGRPVDAADPAPYLFRTYRVDHPVVRVDRPRLGGADVIAAPVQVWYDTWRRRDRVLRYRACCIGCGWLLWSFDDGENDCRGVLGDWSAGFSLDADECDLAGPSVGLCPMCANTGERYAAAMQRATGHWSPRRLVVPVPRGPFAQPALFALEGA